MEPQVGPPEVGKNIGLPIDGDVSPECIGNLNGGLACTPSLPRILTISLGVLDNDKLVMLPNGERLSLPPDVGTPAAISHCCTIWFRNNVVEPSIGTTLWERPVLTTSFFWPVGV